MSQLNEEKLHISCKEPLEKGKEFIPRKYTLTHSDSTGDLYLTIDCDYDNEQISGLYTRFMRDEILAEWQKSENEHELHVYAHVSGGIVFGWAGLRYRIFNYHMPLVLKAIRQGDNKLFEIFPFLEDAPIYIHFLSKRKKYNKIESYGILRDYRDLTD
ncbi:MAG: staygreen family protein [Promethearchaeota archaeon]